MTRQLTFRDMAGETLWTGAHDGAVYSRNGTVLVSRRRYRVVSTLDTDAHQTVILTTLL